MAPKPTVEEAAERVGASPTDPLLPGLLTSALNTQAKVCDCTTDPYTAELHEAALRRFAFLWASKPHTLGVLEVNDFGTQYMPLYHPDWDLLEFDRRTIHLVIA